MEKNDDLILTGWGHAEYVAAAAVALKALGGRADVKGVSRRRLPEFLSQLAAEEGEPRWKRLFPCPGACGMEDTEDPCPGLLEGAVHDARALAGDS